ncbi:hypothetical protein LHP32_000801 [Salmonella enterica]|nr:hypothetical protein [Salmonella enterica]
MSNQYQTQGYTVNDAGRRLIVDPITRIEGHMRCEVNIDEQNGAPQPGAVDHHPHRRLH